MHQMRISTNQVSSVMLRSKKLEIRTNLKTMKELIKTKQSAMKLSLINPSKGRAMHEGDNLNGFKGDGTTPYGDDLHIIWCSLIQGTRIYTVLGWRIQQFYAATRPPGKMKAQVSYSDRLLSGTHLSVCPSVINFHIFDFSRTTWPILTRLGTNHPWGEGIQVCSKEGEHLSPRGDNRERVKTHWKYFKIFSRTSGSIKLSTKLSLGEGNSSLFR
jgi:hypothetical protein